MTRAEILKKYPEVAELRRVTSCIRRHWTARNPQTLDEIKTVILEAAEVENYRHKIQRDLYFTLLVNGDFQMARSGIIRKLIQE